MNIEEERKAFEKQFKPDEGVKWSEKQQWYYSEPSWEEGLRETVNYFQGWLAAKEHTAEMAKPTGSIKESIATGWWVYYDVYQYGGLESKEAAEKWLNDRGYRVIE